MTFLYQNNRSFLSSLFAEGLHSTRREWPSAKADQFPRSFTHHFITVDFINRFHFSCGLYFLLFCHNQTWNYIIKFYIFFVLFLLLGWIYFKINSFQGNMSFQLYLSVQFLDPVHLFICLVCVCMSVRVHVCVTCAYGYMCVCVICAYGYVGACIFYLCIWRPEENVWCPLLSSLSHSFEKGLSLNLELAKSKLSFYQ